MACAFAPTAARQRGLGDLVSGSRHVKDRHGNEYTYSVDSVSRLEWSRYFPHFEDANLYQTWDYAASVFPGQKALRMVVRKGGSVIGLAQGRVASLPGLNRGIAHVAWGPVWRRKGETPDARTLRTVLEALRDGVAVRRKLLLRVVPNLVAGDSGWAAQAFETAGFTRVGHLRAYRTVILDLTGPLEAIRRGLAQKWRNCLNSAERAGLEVGEGTSDAEYAVFLALYAEMRKRKDFDSGVDVHQWGTMQSILPESEKLRIFTARRGGAPVAAIAVSFMGDTGRYLLGATAEAALPTKASYALQWRVIERLKECGFNHYDLGGIDPDENPGGYQFKSRMGGREVEFVGAYRCCYSPVSRLVVSVGEGLRQVVRRCRR